jgi:hypothetical protein
LPEEIRKAADRSFSLLKASPGHRSLFFKRIGQFRSVRIGLHYRALAVEAGEDIVWFWIGSHADYDHLLERRKAVNAPRSTELNRRPPKPLK